MLKYAQNDWKLTQITRSTAYGEETQITRGIRGHLIVSFVFFGPGECARLPFEQIFLTAFIRKCHHICVALKALRQYIFWGSSGGS